MNRAKNKKIGKIGCITVAAVVVIALAALLLLPDDYEEPAPNPIGNLNIANTNNVTPIDNGYKYSDDDTEIILTPIDSSRADSEIGASTSVVTGESGAKSWTAVTDPGEKEVIYIRIGDDAVKATYSESNIDWDENYSTHYIEFADCILYYPSQLSKITHYENNTASFADGRSDAILRMNFSENPYTSMDEVTGFIENSENDTILAYGPAWYTAETRDGENTIYTMSDSARICAVR